MTNEEKIRLVLETLGTDNVKQANRVLREMQEELTKVGAASTQAAGKSGVNGQGILHLAYFIDDLQYGMRGIMNNIPILVQSLGLGAGLAGVAGIAAVAVGTLVEKHPEWFEWSKKVKETLNELTDAIKAEEAAIKRQKEQVDKLGESTSKRIEDILKLKEATESLKEAEAQLAEDRKNAKATEEADKNVGAMATEELAKQKDVVKSVITDAGLQKQVRDELTKAIERTIPEITDAQAYGEGSAIAASEAGPAAWASMQPEARANLARQNMAKGRATLQNQRNEEIRKSVESIFGGLINPANQDELDQAMQGLDKFLPGVSRELRNVYRFDRENEAFDAENERWRRGGGARRRAAERENVYRFDRENEAFDAENERWRRGGGARRRAAEREFAAGKRAEMAQEAAIRNEVLAQFDPTQMAAMRNAQAGMGPFRGRYLKQLEQRDLELFMNALQQRGMAPGEAEQAARKSLMGGRQQFEEFSQSIGKNLDNGLRAQEATVEYFRMLDNRMKEYAMQMQMLMQQMNVMGNAQPSARPQTYRARP